MSQTAGERITACPHVSGVSGCDWCLGTAASAEPVHPVLQARLMETMTCSLKWAEAPPLVSILCPGLDLRCPGTLTTPDLTVLNTWCFYPLSPS